MKALLEKMEDNIEKILDRFKRNIKRELRKCYSPQRNTPYSGTSVDTQVPKSENLGEKSLPFIIYNERQLHHAPALATLATRIYNSFSKRTCRRLDDRNNLIVIRKVTS